MDIVHKKKTKSYSNYLVSNTLIHGVEYTLPKEYNKLDIGYTVSNRHMYEYDGAVAWSTYGYLKVAKHKYKCKQMLLCSLFVGSSMNEVISLTFFILLALVIRYSVVFFPL